MLRISASLAMLALGAGLLAAAVARGGRDAAPIRRNFGTFRVVGGMGTIDPALVEPETVTLALLDATCAQLLRYPDRRGAYRLKPEVAAKWRVSRDGKTYTFALRPGFRFNTGARVRADAFRWAITRTLQLEAVRPGGTNGGTLMLNIVGARAVAAGKAKQVRGITARGLRLVIRLTKPEAAFPAWVSQFCAVPPTLPVNPEGVTTFPAAGPYYVAQHVVGRSILLKRNRFYGGSRPWRVKSIVGTAQADDALEAVARGVADWGWAAPPAYWDPARRLAQRYGVNRSQFWVEPGFTIYRFVFNAQRGVFRGNPRLRQAVNFAVDRRALRRAFLGGARSGRLTDQYLPFGLPGLRDVRIYPFGGNLRQARAHASGHRRGGKVNLYTLDFPATVSAAQTIARRLTSIGLAVQVTKIPFDSYYDRLRDANEPWDLAFAAWAAAYTDPASILNELYDGADRFAPSNVGHFDVEQYNRALRRANAQRGDRRYRAYAALDVQLARDAAPAVAIMYGSEPTLVSRRVDRRCVVLRPQLDLATVCLKR